MNCVNKIEKLYRYTEKFIFSESNCMTLIDLILYTDAKHFDEKYLDNATYLSCSLCLQSTHGSMNK